ncbi:hypothetical protein ROJ8625_01485 [Roseivivax jejudonensis]|uniref:2,4-dihydroxyhept-2-ene-1,7-dioic acid aldolase n=1 Tax=Roseivivax jejudonensis TaxID=1529041 RepID=A0A1X6YV55_9RHOB|nr:DUF2218 domain-containing protein [Roseivivax jejudonensis]SLN32342.1 hypothetical protein ROJ8625_01485 [Roseivivax jejudonensis]
MTTAHTRFETSSADRYLGQMVKHFAHKIPAAQSGRTASLNFPVGDAELAADDGGLDIAVESADAEALDQCKAVVENHLLRFAFREEPAPLVWSD